MVGGNDTRLPGRPIGVRLAAWRARRGLGTVELADRCGLSVERLVDLESGRDWVDRHGLLVRAIAALRIDSCDLTGQPYPPADESHATVTGFAYQVRRTLVQVVTGPEGPSAGAVPAVPSATVNDLAIRVARAADAAASGNEFALALALPELIAGSGAAGAPAADRDQAQQLRARGLLLAAGLLRRLGYRDLAWMLVHAAERQVGTRTDIVVEQVRLLLAGGYPEEALARAAQTAQTAQTAPWNRPGEGDVEHDPDPETALATVVALAHAMAGRPGTAKQALDAAERQARSATARALIASARIVTAVESGATDEVPGLLHATDLTALPLATRAHLLTATAGAAARRGAFADAATHLTEADRLAPLRVRLNPFARDLLAVLPAHADDPGTVRILRALAGRAGLR